MIAWALAAVAWTLSAMPAPRPCDARVRVARQKLGGIAPGAATVDVSADGRYVAFVSLAPLTRADDNTLDDVYVLDRVTDRVSLETPGRGRASDGSSVHPRLSGDGRIVVFASVATNLAGGTVAAVDSQVMRRDRLTGIVTLVSHTPGGAPGNAWSGQPEISDDGRYVVFASNATDLIAGDDANHGGSDVYLFDAADGRVRRISLTATGAQLPWGQSSTPAISATGRYIAFASTAPLDAPPAAPGPRETPVRAVFLRDLSTGTTRRLSTTRGGRPPDGPSYYPSISADGQRVAFVSTATNLDDDARAAPRENVYLHDSRSPRLRLVSRGASGGGADGESRAPAISGDGRYVLFSSEASNLHCRDRCGPLADVNLVSDVFRTDLASGRVERLSGGGTGPDRWWTPSGGAASDRTGQIVAYSSRQPIDAADLLHDDDLFVEDLSTDGACAPTGDGF